MLVFPRGRHESLLLSHANSFGRRGLFSLPYMSTKKHLFPPSFFGPYPCSPLFSFSFFLFLASIPFPFCFTRHLQLLSLNNICSFTSFFILNVYSLSSPLFSHFSFSTI